MAASWWNLWSRMRANLGIGTSVRFGYLPMLRPPGGADALGDPGTLPSVHGAICTLADAICALDFGIVKLSGDGSSAEPAPRHPSAVTLSAWDVSDKWSWIWHGLFGGTSVAWLRDGRLHVYPPERVSMLLYDDGDLRFQLIPVTGGEAFEVDHRQCAVLKYRPIGRDPRLGVSPLISCSPALTLLLQQRYTTNSILRNASRPSGVLQTDQRIDPLRAEALAERWDRARMGAAVGNTAVLEQGLRYEVIKMTDLQQLAATESAHLGVAEVARLYSVPPSILAGDVSNRATAIEDRRRLLSFAVSPLARLAEGALAAVLLTDSERRSGLRVQIDDATVLLGQGSELGSVAASLLNSGALSPNEVRALLSYPPVPDGDLLRAPSNTYALPAWADWEPKSDTENTENDARAFPVSRRRITAQARLLQIRDDLLGPDAP